MSRSPNAGQTALTLQHATSPRSGYKPPPGHNADGYTMAERVTMAKGGKADSRLKRAGVSGYNKPKRTPNHPTKSHIVVAKSGSTIKTNRFGQQGAKTAGKPKAGESRKTKMKRKSFKARHAKNIAKGVLSAAYWANKVKW